MSVMPFREPTQIGRIVSVQHSRFTSVWKERMAPRAQSTTGRLEANQRVFYDSGAILAV